MSIKLESRSTDVHTMDNGITALRDGAERLAKMSLARRNELIQSCLHGVIRQSQRWLEAAWAAKKIPPGVMRAEDIMTGPLSTHRCLRLLYHTFADMQQTGKPRLPGKPYLKNGQVRVPVFPTPHLYDSLLFGPLKAETWMQPGVTVESLFDADDDAHKTSTVDRVIGNAGEDAKVCVVLGAGNVSSIPIADALSKIFLENCAVILKMNPVNDYMGPIFEGAFSCLIDENLFQVVYGDGDVGAQLIHHEQIDEIHITGSDRTHDAIVWGTDEEYPERKAANQPLITKRITSELGNVSPWIVVPGEYTDKQLRFQAQNIVASITNNASFNCIATKMLVTWQGWQQRDQLLDEIDRLLATIPPRYAYYPGAEQRFRKFAPDASPDGPEGTLPWTLVRGVTPDKHPHMFREESFVCVTGQTELPTADPREFLSHAVKFVNNEIWGSLSIAITVPDSLRVDRPDELDNVIRDLRYGTIGVNQWPGVAYALMSPPWGAIPVSTLKDVQSGIGFVHNTYLLDRAEKTVVSSPLTIMPKPMWFSTHRCPEAVASSLQRLYERPSWTRVAPVLFHALRG